MKPVLRTLVVSAATIGLSAALMTAPALAEHKAKHDPGGGGGGGGGGDATYAITLTDVRNGVPVAFGDGVEGPGGTIDGITEPGSFDDIELALISTDGSITADANVQADYNHLCGDVVDPDVGAFEAIDDIRVVHDAEIDMLTVPVEYMVESQSFTLLLQGPYGAEKEFPPTEKVELTIWNNRGGGKGTKNRCGSGHESLDLVTLEIVPQ